MQLDWYNLPIEIQTALAGGYLAYCVAYAGLLPERGALHVAMRSFTFGLPAFLICRALTEHSVVLAVALAVLGAVTLGAVWRIWGRSLWMGLMQALNVHWDDSLISTWTALIQQRNPRIDQISVHTKDGRVLYQNENTFQDAPLRGIYLGSDGGIVMVVQEEELPDGTTEVRKGITDPRGGTRVTYIPADQIARVNIRWPTS